MIASGAAKSMLVAWLPVILPAIEPAEGIC
jgi:hypothetical protein